MRKLGLLTLLTMLLASWPVYGQATIQDIESLKKEGLSETQILDAIQELGGFEMNAKIYLALRKKGFSPNFLETLKNLSSRPKFPEIPQHLRQGYQKADTGSEVENVWALAVGVNSYAQANVFPKLMFAVADAESFARQLMSVGVPPENIGLLTEQEVTRENLAKAVTEIAKAKGTVYIFYSGHGLCSAKSGFYFTCYDTDSAKLKETAYAMSELQKNLESLKGERVILLLDACHSGGAKAPNIEIDDEPETPAKTPEKQPDKPVMPEKVALGKFSKEAQEKVKEITAIAKPIAIITSCREDQVSREGKGNGLFTESLIKGMSGSADEDQNGKVTMEELALYIQTDIQKRTRFAQKPDCNFGRAWTPDKGLPIPSGTTTTPAPEVKKIEEPPVKPSVTKPEVQPEAKTTTKIEVPLTDNKQPGKATPAPSDWPAGLWKVCWNEKDGWVDFTAKEWENLKHEEQVKYATRYQEWCAQKLGLPVEKSFDGGGTSFAMRLIPPGRFWMGSPKEEANRTNSEIRRKVIITKAFWIAKHEVTQGQWQAAMNNNPSQFTGDNRLPVERIYKWLDAQKFCRQAGVRLPTEAEWEYACRAGTTRMYNLGTTITPKKQINCKFEPSLHKNSWEKTVPVQSLPNQNSWGCYDFLGNVWEWCQDAYGDYPAAEVKDPKGCRWDNWQTRVCRGGDWESLENNCRSAMRYRSSGNLRGVGLRVIVGSRYSLKKESLAESGWPLSLWQACWKEKEKLADFTTPEWESLADDEQMEYAGKYQAWYAKKMGKTVQRSLEFNGEPLLTLNFIPPARFYIGSWDEEADDESKPRHKVVLSHAFWITETEITQKQWQTVMNEIPHGNTSTGDDIPVASIKTEAIEEFCEKTGLQLPTESQWEWAGRAGVTGIYPWGNTIDSNYFWEYDDAGGVTRPVRQKKPNGFGLYDVIGNVAERCADLWSRYSAQEVKDPQPITEGHVVILRGGAYAHSFEQCRIALRHTRGVVSSSSPNLGLRLLLEVK